MRILQDRMITWIRFEMISFERVLVLIQNDRNTRKRRSLCCVILLISLISGSIITYKAVTAREHQELLAAESMITSYQSIQIQPGDSLWSIADTYMQDPYEDIRDYMQTIKEINCMKDDQLRSGDYLIIPYEAHKP